MSGVSICFPPVGAMADPVGIMICLVLHALDSGWRAATAKPPRTLKPPYKDEHGMWHIETAQSISISDTPSFTTIGFAEAASVPLMVSIPQQIPSDSQLAAPIRLIPDLGELQEKYKELDVANKKMIEALEELNEFVHKWNANVVQNPALIIITKIAVAVWAVALLWLASTLWIRGGAFNILCSVLVIGVAISLVASLNELVTRDDVAFVAAAYLGTAVGVLFSLKL